MELEELSDDSRVEPSSDHADETDAEAVASTPTRELRRSSRVPKPNPKYLSSLHYLLLTDSGEPENYDEALQVNESVKWEHAMQEEIDSLHTNDTWELARLPAGKRALYNK